MTQNRSISSLIVKPFNWVNEVLSRDFKLRRDGRRFRVVIEDSKPPSPPHGQLPGGKPPALDDIALSMQIELRHLINQHIQTRQLMRHLGYIERMLRLGGPQALNDIPLDVLSKGYTQLKSIVRDWSTPGLSELRSRLAVTIADKEEEANRQRPANSRLSDFFTTTRIQVSEGTASDFQAAEQTWAK